MVQFQPSGIGDFSMTLMLPHWDKNLHLSQKSLVENHIFQEVHIFKIAFLAKSHFRITFLAKITFSKYHFSQSSHFSKYQIQVNLWTIIVILPQCGFPTELLEAYTNSTNKKPD